MFPLTIAGPDKTEKLTGKAEPVHQRLTEHDRAGSRESAGGATRAGRRRAPPGADRARQPGQEEHEQREPDDSRLGQDRQGQAVWIREVPVAAALAVVVE